MLYKDNSKGGEEAAVDNRKPSTAAADRLLKKHSLDRRTARGHNLPSSQLNNQPTNHFFLIKIQNRFSGTVIVLIVF